MNKEPEKTEIRHGQSTTPALLLKDALKDKIVAAYRVKHPRDGAFEASAAWTPDSERVFCHVKDVRYAKNIFRLNLQPLNSEEYLSMRLDAQTPLEICWSLPF